MQKSARVKQRNNWRELYEINEKDEVKKKELQTEMEQWTETLLVNKQKLIVKLDTGADCNVMSYCENWMR